MQYLIFDRNENKAVRDKNAVCLKDILFIMIYNNMPIV